MIQQTKGIVLSSIKYAESSIICRIYTESLGLQSYIVNGVRKKKGKNTYYQPLNILDLEVYHKEKSGLHRIKECKIDYQYQEAPFHIYKSSVLLFLAEVLGKCLKEESANADLFSFLEGSLIHFDQKDFNSTFHLHFLVGLSDFLGFCPEENHNNWPFFDLIEGCFCAIAPTHQHFIQEPLTTTFTQLLSGQAIAHNKKDLLGVLLDYYVFHIDGFGKVQSLEVLQTVLNT